MNLHEYQGKEILASHGVRIQRGYVANNAEEAVAKKRELVWIKRIPEMWEMIKKINNKEQE